MNDAYYLKKYGIDAGEFRELSKDGCNACGAFGVTRSLHVDHTHKFKYIKLTTEKRTYGWWSGVKIYDQTIDCVGRTKNEAIQGCRKKLKRASVRGVLCFGCNSSLRSLRDNPDIAEKLAQYLRKFEAKFKDSAGVPPETKDLGEHIGRCDRPN